MEVKKTVDKGVHFSQTFLLLNLKQTAVKKKKLALKVLSGINIFRRDHFSLVFTYLRRYSCSTINLIVVSIYFYWFLKKTSPSQLTVFFFSLRLFFFFFQSRNGFWWWQMTTIIQTSRVPLSGRADHNTWTFHQTHQCVCTKPADALRAPHLKITNTLPKGRKEWGRGFSQAAWSLFSRRGKMVQADPGKLTQFVMALHFITELKKKKKFRGFSWRVETSSEGLSTSSTI